jgi:hypothetical protein
LLPAITCYLEEDHVAITKADHVAGSDLTKKQRKAALALLAKRPAVLPGTRAILIAADQSHWHDLVTKAAIELRLNPAQIVAFCDLAGVAD